jgi:hypothetical protein
VPDMRNELWATFAGYKLEDDSAVIIVVGIT